MNAAQPAPDTVAFQGYYGSARMALLDTTGEVVLTCASGENVGALTSA